MVRFPFHVFTTPRDRKQLQKEWTFKRQPPKAAHVCFRWVHVHPIRLYVCVCSCGCNNHAASLGKRKKELDCFATRVSIRSLCLWLIEGYLFCLSCFWISTLTTCCVVENSKNSIVRWALTASVNFNCFFFPRTWSRNILCNIHIFLCSSRL